MPGFGESDQLNEEPSGFSIAGALVRGLDTIIGAHTAFQVAGFSFGGSIAGHIASLAPKRVERLVLIGSGGLRLPRPPPIDLAAWRHLDDAEAVRATHRSNLATLMFHDPGRIDDFAVAVQEANARRARFEKSSSVSCRHPTRSPFGDHGSDRRDMGCAGRDGPRLHCRARRVSAEHRSGRGIRRHSRRRSLGAVRGGGSVQSGASRHSFQSTRPPHLRCRTRAFSDQAAS